MGVPHEQHFWTCVKQYCTTVQCLLYIDFRSIRPPRPD
jgi:hypothetical protein